MLYIFMYYVCCFCVLFNCLCNTDEIRHRLFDKEFEFPNLCRHCTNFLIIIWTLVCGIVTSIWCLLFDIEIHFKNNVNVESKCNSNGHYYNYGYDEWLNYYQTELNISNLKL